MARIIDDSRAYENLTKRFALRPIHNDEQNDRAAGICDELTDRLDKLTSAEKDYLEVLGDLISKYESRWDEELGSMPPRELIEFLMEQNGLVQKDLVSEFGGASRISEFLSGERKSLSLEQAKKLAHRFKLNIGAFIES